MAPRFFELERRNDPGELVRNRLDETYGRWRLHGLAEARRGVARRREVGVEHHRKVAQEQAPGGQHLDRARREAAQALGREALEGAPLDGEVRVQVGALEARLERVEV